MMALMERFCEVIGPARDQRTLAAVLWRIERAVRDSFVKDDPWSGLEHARVGVSLCEDLNHTVLLRLARGCRGRNLWYLGALAEADQVLSGDTPGDDELGTIASTWLFCLAWLRADRDVLDQAQRAAECLIHFGQSHTSSWKKAEGAGCSPRCFDANGAMRLPSTRSRLLWRSSRASRPTMFRVS